MRLRHFALGTLALTACGAARPTAPAIAPSVTVAPAVLRPAPPEAPAPPPAARATPPPTAPAPSPAPATPEVHVRSFRGHPEDELLQAMATRPVVRVIERFSSSTLVYHLDLGDGLEVAFKPAREGEPGWWQHEIAGYRLARALGIEGRVPPAVTRRVPVAALEGLARDAGLVVTGADQGVEGAAIFWMPVLRRSDLETPASRREWVPWLDPTVTIPPEHRERAAQLAALVVFDYLQANFDRWNSANIRQDEQGDLVFRDNNRGWFLVNLRRTDRGGLDGIRRIPAALLAGVARADAAALRAAIAADPGPHGAILGAPHYAAYERRRQAVLARVRDEIARHGRNAVCPWP